MKNRSNFDFGSRSSSPISPNQFFLKKIQKSIRPTPASGPHYKSRQYAVHLRHEIPPRRCRYRLRPHRPPRRCFPTAAAAPLSTFPPGSCHQKLAGRGEDGLCGGPVAPRRWWCADGCPGGPVRRDPRHRRPHVRRQDYRAPPPGSGRGRQWKVRNAGGAAHLPVSLLVSLTVRARLPVIPFLSQVLAN